MIKYLLGFFLNIFRPNISSFALIDIKSKVSKKAKIYRQSKIYNSEVGDYSYIGPRSQIINAEIGKFCSVAFDCNIGLASHTLSHISTSPIFTECKNGTGYRWVKADKYKNIKVVRLGNDVWVGTKSIIMSGVEIGDGAVIAAGAIVTKDIPAYAIVGGIPAKIIKYRFDLPIRELLQGKKWWNLPEKELKSKICYFQRNEINEEVINSL